MLVEIYFVSTGWLQKHVHASLWSTMHQSQLLLLQARTIEKSREARAQLSAAKARHDKLLEARRTVQALQYALEAGQIQVLPHCCNDQSHGL